jgi:hypothetical protein
MYIKFNIFYLKSMQKINSMDILNLDLYLALIDTENWAMYKKRLVKWRDHSEGRPDAKFLRSNTWATCTHRLTTY